VGGVGIRVGRLFDGHSHRSCILALDHGLTMGPQVGNVDVVSAVGRLVAGGPDGVLIGPGLANRAADAFAVRGAPALVLRVDQLILDERLGVYGEQHRMLVSPAEAARLGADALAVFLVLGVDGLAFADNAAAVARTVEQAHGFGLPVVVETTLWGPGLQDKKDPDLLAFGCRVAAELGADVVKTEYTGDPDSMRPVIDGCPAPILVLGGARTGDEEALFANTQDALDAGARGVVYGRSVWQADDPVAIAHRLRSVVHAAADRPGKFSERGAAQLAVRKPALVPPGRDGR